MWKMATHADDVQTNKGTCCIINLNSEGIFDRLSIGLLIY